MGGLEELNQAMLEAGFFPEKKYSQNFLVDEQIVNELVDSAHVQKSDSVLEIGGGTGIVTQKLAQTGAKITTIELHENLAKYLEKKMGNQKNVRVFQGDFLHFPLSTISFNKIVASPPYAISDDIMFKVLAHEFDWASLIWQLEFTEKILAPPGSGEYHPLSVIGQYLFDGKILKKVSPRAFYPVPNHFSSILLLKRRKKRDAIPHFPVFVSFIRTLFRFKNKTLSNAGKQLVKNPVAGVDADKFRDTILKNGLENEKVFLVEPENFIQLFLDMQK